MPQKYESARKLDITTPSETEIKIEAILNAPRNLVYEAHIDPLAIPLWWGPSYLETTVVELDPQPGGKWRFEQRDKEGNEYIFFGEFKELIPPSKLVWTFNFEPFPDSGSVETIVFEEIEKNRTKITVHSVYPSVEARDGMIQSDMESGYGEGLDRLEKLLIQNTLKQKVMPCLWFDHQAEEAMNYYIDIFNTAPHSDRSSQIVSIDRYSNEINAPRSEELRGKVITGIFELNGQRYMCLDGGPMFQFDESISFYVECKDQEEVDHFWNKFIEDGGEESMCGWLKDKFGISWQIIPRRLGELASDKDREKAMRVVNRMLKMKKIIVEDLEKAYYGD